MHQRSRSLLVEVSGMVTLHSKRFSRIIEAFPLLRCEEFTELGITKSDRLERAHFLHGIGIWNIQLEPIKITLQTRNGILEINCFPRIRVWYAAPASPGNIIIGARSVWGKSIV